MSMAMNVPVCLAGMDIVLITRLAATSVCPALFPVKHMT
jgi:hypothetical protein